jgi:thiol-disulfide isomerase/thioredoxin
MRVRGLIVAALAATLAIGLAACTSGDGIAGEYGSGAGTVSSDGAYLELAPDQRGESLIFSGPTVDGGELSSGDLLGEITVVNFWYAGCPPCRVEASDLAELSSELTDVQFVGVNVLDDAAVAMAFDEEFGIEYPSILDARRADSVQLAFAGEVAPNAVPTTIVLDTEGRVAARISGIIRDPSILRAMITTVQENG